MRLMLLPSPCLLCLFSHTKGFLATLYGGAIDTVNGYKQLWREDGIKMFIKCACTPNLRSSLPFDILPYTLTFFCL